MPHGYTECKYCGEQLSSRSVKIHLQTCRGCPDTERPTIKKHNTKKQKKAEIDLPEIIVPKKPEMKDWDKPRCDTTILEKSESLHKRPPKQTKYENPLFADGIPVRKSRKDRKNNPYNIALRFIKNQIEDGSINLNIAQLVNDGRATIKLSVLKQEMLIIVDLAKYRKSLNNRDE